MSTSPIPDKPDLAGLEDKWDAVWDAAGTYHFDTDTSREQVFSIDTPPPTVSGSLHVGHVFSYTHTDTIACLLYTSPSPRDLSTSRMPSSA